MDRSEFFNQRSIFFRTLYSGTEGFVVLAHMTKDMKNFKEEFYRWPDEKDAFLAQIEILAQQQMNLYYCPQVFRAASRKKDTVAFTTCAWADLDECAPIDLELQPSVTIETSQGRYQGIWLFEKAFDPKLAENLSRRIAAAHKQDGADHCWNLGRLLRIPYTLNLKKFPPYTVAIIGSNGARYRLADFDAFPLAEFETGEHLEIPFPDEWGDLTAESVLQEHKEDLGDDLLELHRATPSKDESWSHVLWNLLMLLFEAGLTREEVYLLAETAACNKFRRDNKPKEALWSDVCRAFFKHQFNRSILKPAKPEPDGPIITDEELTEVERDETWVERYITWASSLGDAATQYHQAGAFVSLSGVLAGNVRLPTSFGNVIPNLWFMILGDTTLTRKSTSIDVAVDVAEEVDQGVVLATDGSLEGMLTALSTRPGRPGIFLRDEFSGLLEQMTKRDYMAGFAEMLTKLYDGKVQKRVLAKQVIEIRDPVVILYTGGIKSRIQEILTEEQVASGFLPRFVFILAESDPKRVQPLGPPTQKNWGARSTIVAELHDIRASYEGFVIHNINGREIQTNKRRVWTAELTPAAWDRYNQLEARMMYMGLKAPKPDLYTPLYDRLCKSILKAAVLIAASKQLGVDTVKVDRIDVLHAMKYGQGWRDYAKEMIASVGSTRDEKRVMNVYHQINRSSGVSKSSLMQMFQLTSRDASWILDTLEQRGLIQRVQMGKTELLKPVNN